jgi:hypothetical protein
MASREFLLIDLLQYTSKSVGQIRGYSNPEAAHKYPGRRPAVLLSPSAYNVGLALLCPITNQHQAIHLKCGFPRATGDRRGTGRLAQRAGLAGAVREVYLRVAGSGSGGGADEAHSPVVRLGLTTCCSGRGDSGGSQLSGPVSAWWSSRPRH